MHRKNSSESSEEVSLHPVLESVTSTVPQYCRSDLNVTTSRDDSANSYAKAEKTSKRQRAGTDGFVAISITDESKVPTLRSSFRKLSRQPSMDSQASSLVNEGVNNYCIKSSGRRHSNVTNGSLGYIPSLSPTSNIKPTGSLELGYIDKNPNQTLTIENYNYFKNNRSCVRRIRSTALETCCPAPSTLEVHPNSLEIICGHYRNPALPPPSSTLVRNQHFSLCPHFSYGSEIVYPIAEQSDEHQTSHGPDTDVESIQHNSDSDYEENNTGSRSPLLYRLDNVDCVKMIHSVPSAEKDLRKMCRFKENDYKTNSSGYHAVTQKQSDSDENGERTSANSKEALLNENENSNSSETPEMQDAVLDCYATDNEYSDKKYSECSNCTDSNTSLDRDETVVEKSDLNRPVKLKNMVLLKDSDKEGKSGEGVKRRLGMTRRQRKSNSARALEEPENCLSLMGLDWLFERNENDNQQKGIILSINNF